MEFLAVEVEGLPDIAGGRQVYGLAPTLPDRDVAKVIFHHHLHSRSRDPFLPLHLRSVGAVSVVRFRDERPGRTDLSVGAGGEGELLQKLAHIFSRWGDQVIVWDGERNIAKWLALRALVHGMAWNAPVERRLASEFGLADTLANRCQLARRLDIPAAEIPDDESCWQCFRDRGIAAVTARCALNAAATARLWLRYCLARDSFTAEEHAALAVRLARMTPSRASHAA